MLLRFAAPLAAAMGIGGVLLYAAAAHAGDGAGSQSAFSISTGALMLLAHAPVVFAIGVAARVTTALGFLLWILSALLFAVGNALFAASVSVPYLTTDGLTLFSGAGPYGAFMVIGGWLAVAVAGFVSR